MSSSVERNNPPPRQKACDACRAAKRRCDLALPSCFRCTRRNIACVYPGLPAPDQIPDLLALMNEHEGLDTTCSDEFVFAPVSTSLPVLDPPPQSSPWDDHPHRDPSNIIQLLPHYELTHRRTSTGMPLSALMASRFQYAIDTLKNTPRMMVMENQTPWSHRELYRDGMPRVMQDAYACCALFITKNPINGPMITNHVHSRHQDLILSPLPTSPSELLAHTHALLLYQIMQVFDPDLTAAINNSSLGSLSISALESAASLLFSSTHFPPSTEPDIIVPSPSPSDTDASPDPNYNPTRLPTTLPSTMHFWPLWLFEESARRTILFTFYFQQMVHLFRGTHNLKCDGKLGLLHSWYASAYLWNAPTALDFALAWTQKEHYIVRNVNFEKMLSEAMPGDVDTFARMLLVTSRGVDQVREWFSGRGAIL
ncbi:hypothetical protein BJX70DRAFT_155045 [Aspergillus crustosus]